MKIKVIKKINLQAEIKKESAVVVKKVSAEETVKGWIVETKAAKEKATADARKFWGIN